MMRSLTDAVPKNLNTVQTTPTASNETPNPCSNSSKPIPSPGLPTAAAADQTMKVWRVLSEYHRWRLHHFGLPTLQPWTFGGYLIAGKTGSGKTCLAAALIRDRMNPGHPATLAVQKEQIVQEDGKPKRIQVWTWPEASVGWYYAQELPRRIMDSWGKATEHDVLKSIFRAQIIVIDDLGAEKHSEHTVPVMREVVERCVNGGIDLIVTTNLDVKALVDRDARLASRLAMLQPIELPDVDLRLARRREPLKARPGHAKV
jgi:nucleoside-triphosphatase THEP1